LKVVENFKNMGFIFFLKKEDKNGLRNFSFSKIILLNGNSWIFLIFAKFPTMSRFFPSHSISRLIPGFRDQPTCILPINLHLKERIKTS